MKLFRRDKIGIKQKITLFGFIKFSYYSSNKKLLRSIHKQLQQLRIKASLDNNIFQFNNTKFYVPNYPYDLIQTTIVDSGSFFEIDILKKLDPYLNEDSIILDVGANIGNHTVYWAHIRKVRHVYSFEPVLQTYAKLVKNIEINNLQNRVNAYNYGCASETIRASEIHFSANNIGETRLEKNDDGCLRLIALDQWMEETNPEKIDFIKIDVEGFEKETLLGAERLINKYKPICFVEILGSDDFVFRYFEKKGYFCKKAYECGNYLFMPNA